MRRPRSRWRNSPVVTSSGSGPRSLGDSAIHCTEPNWRMSLKQTLPLSSLNNARVYAFSVPRQINEPVIPSLKTSTPRSSSNTTRLPYRRTLQTTWPASLGVDPSCTRFVRNCTPLIRRPSTYGARVLTIVSASGSSGILEYYSMQPHTAACMAGPLL